MARKQVERLRPSARLQAVARPVETYVRPAEQPAPKSGLGEFIRAIAPAAEDLAQIEKHKQLTPSVASFKHLLRWRLKTPRELRGILLWRLIGLLVRFDRLMTWGMILLTLISIPL